VAQFFPAPWIPATGLPLLHEMEEEGRGEEARLGASRCDFLPNRTTLSPALSRSFVAGEGDDHGQPMDAPGLNHDANETLNQGGFSSLIPNIRACLLMPVHTNDR